MRITFLLEVADQLWGGVKVALEDANWLSSRGHQVTVVSRSAPPAWMQVNCGFLRVPDFRPEHLPDADVIIGTFWSTVPWAASAGPGKGIPVHFCQGFEGDNPENAAVRERIEAVYRLPGMHHVTISPHLTTLLHERFGLSATELRYVVDHGVHKPAEARASNSPLRVGLVGPYQVPWKDLQTGYAACQLAHKAGQELILVRASNIEPSPEERNLPFPVEWHQTLRPDEMGDFYRSLDVFLGTSRGAEEGFFLPAIEAMACGVPSVLTDIPCFRNHERLVGHDRYALFVEAKDPAAMAEALVLAGALPEIRSALREAGFEVADKYRLQEHGEQFEALLQRLVVDAGPSAATPSATSLPSPCAVPPPPPAPEPKREPPQRPSLTLPPEPTGDPVLAPHRDASKPAARKPEANKKLRLVPRKTPPATPPPAGIPQKGLPQQGIPQPNRPAAASDEYADLQQLLHEAAGRCRASGDHRRAARLLAAEHCLVDADVHAAEAAELLRAIGDSHLLAGEAERALAVYDEQLQAGLDDEGTHTGRGNALHALGRMHEAAQAFRAALAVGTRTADSYNRLGVVLFQAGDLPAARQSFERALVLDPEHAEARENLLSLPAA
ncbi:MAG: glycosyltransferase [Planctomycetota bacterium]